MHYQFQFNRYNDACPSYINISDINSNHSQVLRIDCDAPTTTEQKTSQTTQSDPTTDTSGKDSSMTTSTSTQTKGDTTATAPKTDTSKSVENVSMTTDLNNAKVKGKLEYSIITSRSCIVNYIEVSFNYSRTTCILYFTILKINNKADLYKVKVR